MINWIIYSRIGAKVGCNGDSIADINWIQYDGFINASIKGALPSLASEGSITKLRTELRAEMSAQQGEMHEQTRKLESLQVVVIAVGVVLARLGIVLRAI